jgi:hypothetical protein
MNTTSIVAIYISNLFYASSYKSPNGIVLIKKLFRNTMSVLAFIATVNLANLKEAEYSGDWSDGRSWLIIYITSLSGV